MARTGPGWKARAPLALLSFGSASAAVAEAAELLAERGVELPHGRLRLIAPLQEAR